MVQVFAGLGGNSAAVDAEVFFDIAPRINPGSLFGIPFRFLPSWMSPTHLHLALLGAAAFFLFRHVRARVDGRVGIAAGLILAGGIGNLLDRFRWGGALDFVSLGWPGALLRWPAFNLADIAICLGVGLLVWLEVRTGCRTKIFGEVRG